MGDVVREEGTARGDDEQHIIIEAPNSNNVRRRLTVTFVAVLISLTSTCVFYRELYALGDYPRFTNALNTAIAAVLPGTAVILAHVSGRRESWRRRCADRWRPMPSWSPTFLVLAVCNALQNSMQIAAIDGLGPDNSNLTTLLNQATVPITMAISAVMLPGSAFTRSQVLGAALVVGGVCVAVAPHLEGERSTPVRVLVPWAAVCLVSCIPQSVLNIIVEQLATKHSKWAEGECQEPRQGLRDSRAPEEYFALALTMTVILDLTWMVGVFNALSLPLNIIFGLLLGPWPPEKAFRRTMDDFADGAQCLTHGASYDSHCDGVVGIVVLFAPISIMYLVANFVLVQEVSAAWYFLVVAATLPLQNLCLASRAIMGEAVSDLHATDAYGLAVVTLGMAVYLLRKETVDGAWRRVCAVVAGTSTAVKSSEPLLASEAQEASVAR